MLSEARVHAYVISVYRERKSEELSQIVRMMAKYGVCTTDEAEWHISAKHQMWFVSDKLYKRNPRGVSKVLSIHRMGVRS